MKKQKYIFSFILDPVFIIAFILMIINDFWFKSSGLLPLLAGKLSDIAILIFLPAVPALAVLYIIYLIHIFSGNRSPVYLNQAMIVCSILFIVILYVLIKTNTLINKNFFILLNNFNLLKPAIRQLGGIIDPWDLVVLPAISLSYIRMMRYIPGK
jgi:hypothetical protein